MPQIFQVLRCYQCSVFQVHQTKKSNKFQCKLCGEKQSIKRNYGIGTSKDCRLHVQKLNGIRGENCELRECEDNVTDDEEEHNPKTFLTPSYPKEIKKSKWSEYVGTEIEEQTLETETMYLDNNEVVLEIPRKRRKANFKCPIAKPSTNIANNGSCEADILQDLNIINESTILNKNLNAQQEAETWSENMVIQHEIKRKEFISPIKNLNMKKDCANFAPTKSSHSKWAQFIDGENNDTDNDSYENEIPSSLNKPVDAVDIHERKVNMDSNIKKSQKLFALCDDNELDDILDF